MSLITRSEFGSVLTWTGGGSLPTEQILSNSSALLPLQYLLQGRGDLRSHLRVKNKHLFVFKISVHSIPASRDMKRCNYIHDKAFNYCKREEINISEENSSVIPLCKAHLQKRTPNPSL